MKVGIAVYCTLCKLRKKPHGRSAPMEMANSLCDGECPGYREAPLPGCLWPGETDEGFPSVCEHATEEIPPVSIPIPWKTGTMNERLGYQSRCLVPFCRKGCPVLPEDAEVTRANGRCLCEKCSKPFDDHETFAYPTGMKHVVKGCDGKFYHL